jgi:very-short-patch-repair endonuclease
MGHIDDIARQLTGATRGLGRATELYAAGVPHSTASRRVTHGVWDRPHDGVIDTTRAAWDWERRVLAAVLSGPPGTLASHRSAAQLHGLPLGGGAPIEITTPRGGRSRARPVRVHSSIRPDAGTLVGPVPITSGRRTAVDLATCTNDRTYARCLRELMRRGLVRASDLTEPTLRHLHGHQRFIEFGHRERDAALHRTESVLEVDGLDWLLHHGFEGFITQLPVVIGVERYRLDVAWPHQRVALEWLGARWHADALSTAADEDRRHAFEGAGWHVIDGRTADLHGAAASAFAHRIRATLANAPTLSR